MTPYKPWDFCKSIACKSLTYPGTEEDRKLYYCDKCKAYAMHQYLSEQGQIAEEGSALLKPGLTYEQQYLFDLCGHMADAWRCKFDVLADRANKWHNATFTHSGAACTERKSAR